VRDTNGRGKSSAITCSPPPIHSLACLRPDSNRPGHRRGGKATRKLCPPPSPRVTELTLQQNWRQHRPLLFPWPFRFGGASLSSSCSPAQSKRGFAARHHPHCSLFCACYRPAGLDADMDNTSSLNRVCRARRPRLQERAILIVDLPSRSRHAMKRMPITTAAVRACRLRLRRS